MNPPYRSCRRIALIQAPLGRKELPVYPLGLVTLAGAITPIAKDLVILDPNIIGEDQTGKILTEFAPDLIGISLRNIDSQMRRDLVYYYISFKKYLIKVKQWIPNAMIMVGGSGFSLFPEQIMMQNPCIDLGLYLEADTCFPEIIEHLHAPEHVKGIYYRKEGRLIYSGDRRLPSPDEFASPRYDLLDPRLYQASGGVGVQTKRGCPMHCAYCTYPHLNGNRFRFRPVEQVLTDIRTLYFSYGIREITIVDGIFNLPKERSVTMIRRMADEFPGLKWRAWFTESGFDREFAVFCRDSGCHEFSFSPDAFSLCSLKLLGKEITPADIHRIYRLAKEIPDIRVAFNFFWNPPGQDVVTFIKMLLFAVQCKLFLREKAGGIIFGNPRIEPHTPLWHIAVQEGVITDDSELLPDNVIDLQKTFYSQPRTRYLDSVFYIYEMLWRLKKRIRNSPL